MFIREKSQVTPVEWGSGPSHRLLVEADNMGFGICHTVVRAGTKSRLQYRRHLEACYCISGSGRVEAADGSVAQDLTPGVLYVLDEHDAHFLIASPDQDMELVSVFNPPLKGDESHALSDEAFSQY
ncbi:MULTISPECIES: ectoine synthase [Streptomyces]|jgi:L-ectoine synthase|uniref:L-ectoine synthase n=1 Tax=Streptomyces kaempferi TaxID=333725 RepID=A0ABW3XMT3_9ACTN|nr:MULTISPECIES: ectoine synthase [unclassified Streptomyces]QIY60471.1 L-ectoine synthase [Streptomyces sp. RPA4-2]WSS81654.1 ectoine synthase [Streptomyces sp. NBC_01176]WSS89361.1 ectoine synthase [Streptomyces sp. NBC_01176]